MLKNRRNRIVVGIELLLLCMIVTTLSTNAIGINIASNGVSYNKNNQSTVQDAINDLYSKVVYGDATSNEILSGKKALVGGKEVVGTFTCPTLASLTFGDVTPENIDEGKIAWVKGERLVGTKRLLADQVELGDYISYHAQGGYDMPSLATDGFGQYQDVLLYELDLWRVIRKNEDGTVDIVSSFISSSEIGFMSRDYKNFIGELNRIAKAYETKGLTVGSRAMGYGRDEELEYITADVSDEGYKSDVNLIEMVIGSLKAMKADNSRDYHGYWLASRGKDYRLRKVINGQVTLTDESLNPSSPGLGESASIRPIVVLRSDLKITGGNGTKESPYTLGV